MFAFDIRRSFGRIQIFRLALRQNSRAERDRIAVQHSKPETLCARENGRKRVFFLH